MINYINKLLLELFPINRSITGKGFIDSLKILIIKKNLKLKSIKSGSKVYDWVVPKVWEVKEAYIKYDNKKIIDYKNNNLHIISYSSKIKKKLFFKELKNNLHFSNKYFDAIPYLTSYYKKNWGFCLSRKEYLKLSKFKKKFEIFIDSKFSSGKLNWGEVDIKGKYKKTIFFSSYLCHPSMANNELSGPIVLSLLINFLSKRKNKYSYKFLFLPETIGSICYLKKNFIKIKNKILCGFVVTCVGDKGKFSYVSSRYGDSLADKVLNKTLNNKKISYKKYSYLKRGSDERQFNSPLINLPFVTITRSKFETYKEYHTSKDNLNFVDANNIKESFNLIKQLILNIEKKIYPKCKFACEPMLSKRNLYPYTRGIAKKKDLDLPTNILNFLSYSDGRNDLESISKYIEISLEKTKKIYLFVKKNGLIEDM